MVQSVACYYRLHAFFKFYNSCKVQRSSDGVHITSEGAESIVTFDPFRVDVRINGEIAAVLNSRGLLNFEHYRKKESVLYIPVVYCYCKETSLFFFF